MQRCLPIIVIIVINVRCTDSTEHFCKLFLMLSGNRSFGRRHNSLFHADRAQELTSQEMAQNIFFLPLQHATNLRPHLLHPPDRASVNLRARVSRLEKSRRCIDTRRLQRCSGLQLLDTELFLLGLKEILHHFHDAVGILVPRLRPFRH